MLLKVWGVTRSEVDAYLAPSSRQKRQRRNQADAEADVRLGGFRNTGVGEAASPGPSSQNQPSSCSQVQILSLNAQSPNGAWDFLEFCQTLKHPIAAALQETRFSPSEADAFCRAARRAGFHTHVVAGTPTRNLAQRVDRPRGGVMWLVDRRLRFRLAESGAKEDSQVCAAFYRKLAAAEFSQPA